MGRVSFASSGEAVETNCGDEGIECRFVRMWMLVGLKAWLASKVVEARASADDRIFTKTPKARSSSCSQD